MGLWEFFFGGEDSEEKKAADKLWEEQRRKNQERKYGMSWILGNDLDLINRQHGKKNYYGGTYTEEGGVHPDDEKRRNEGGDTSFLGLF